jgi:hypothetical protein
MPMGPTDHETHQERVGKPNNRRVNLRLER